MAVPIISWLLSEAGKKFMTKQIGKKIGNALGNSGEILDEDTEQELLEKSREDFKKKQQEEEERQEHQSKNFRKLFEQ